MSARGPLPLEPEAIEFADARDQLCHMLSIAISLKRIADTICGDAGHCSFPDHLETMLFNFAQRMRN